MKPETAWYEFARNKVKRALFHKALRNYKAEDTTTASIANIEGVVCGAFQSAVEAHCVGASAGGDGVAFRCTNGFWQSSTITAALTGQKLWAVASDRASVSARAFAVGGTTAPVSATTNSTSWTSSTSFGTRTAILNAVAYGTVAGTATVIAGGAAQNNANGIVTATGASSWATWTPVSVTGPNLSTLIVRDLLFDATLGLWIMAVGDAAAGDGGIYTAPESDVATWTARLTGVDIAALDSYGGTIYAIGRLTATNKFYTSTNGTSWTLTANGGNIQGSPLSLAASHGFVAVGATASNLSITKDDGATWERNARPASIATTSDINSMSFLDDAGTGATNVNAFCLRFGCDNGTSYMSERVPLDAV